MSTVGLNRHGMIYVDDLRESASYTCKGDDDSDYADVEESSDESFHSEGEEIAECWDPYLYQLQLQSPKPNRIGCAQKIPDAPSFFGEEYHGSISRDDTALLLGKADGNYLVRQGLSQPDSYSLSFVFGEQVRHYRLFYARNCYYVGEKPFDTIEDLVQDGLITLYMEANNVELYLKSAKESLRPEQPPPYTPPKEGEGSSEGTGDPSPLPGGKGVGKRNRYSPCTIPVKRDSIILGDAPSSAPTVDELKDSSAQGEASILSPSGAMPKTEDRVESLYFHYEKPHNFKLHNYLSMAWCDYCRNFMWGLRAQGYRCKDCGYSTHKQCKDEKHPNCQPSRLLVKKVYGVELTTIVKMHATKIPVVLKTCIEEVERRGLDFEGLYRVSGKSNDLLKIKKIFDSEGYADLTGIEDIHAITGALKLYLRELPLPLMTFEAYEICLIAAKLSTPEELPHSTPAQSH
ncbi:hypothetical protein EMCRGX_G028550 [Ephydatia muelleri]